MQISEMAPELVGCLRAKLGAAAQNNPKPSASSAAALSARTGDKVESDHK